MENILKYGILVDPLVFYRVITDPTFVPCIQLMLGLWAMAFVSLMTEKILATGFVSESIAKALVTVHTAAVVIVPAYVVYTRDCQVAGAVAVLTFASVTFLKLISYHMVNYWCRLESPVASRGRSKLPKRRDADADPPKKSNGHADPGTKAASEGEESGESAPLVEYPDNLNVRDMCYFMLVPTLCYELNFPRSKKVRKRFLIRRTIEVVFLSQLMLGLVQQWLFPTIVNSAGPLKQMNFPKMFERLLKLAVSEGSAPRPPSLTLFPSLDPSLFRSLITSSG